MIKKFILSLFIGTIGIISFCNATLIGNELPYSFYMDNTYNTIKENLEFENSEGGNRLYRKYTAGGAKRAILWNNGKLYTYFYENQNSKYQGFFNKACKLYSLSGTYDAQGPFCRENEYTEENLNEFYNLNDYKFTHTITPNQYNWNYYDPTICFYNENNKYYYCMTVEFHDGGDLEIPNNTTDFSDYAENSPFGNGTGNNTNTNTNKIRICPTIKQIMQSMGENYNTGLCYNNTTFFNGTNFEQTEKEDIFTIFNDDYQEYTNRISIYRNNCTNANTTQACQNAFSGEYKKYSIISNAKNSNVDKKKLRNYCNLGLNYDQNATTCVISGGIKEPYTNEEMIESLINYGEIPTPGINETGTNNVLNALKKCENGDRDCYVNNRNFIDSLKNIYGKITGLFRERNGVNGIIPSYILRIAFLTILFTVIFKK